MRKAISVKKRLAITLWCLATPVEYRTIAHLFGVSRSSVCEIVQETCLAIMKCLLHVYIKFPTGQQLQEVVNYFESWWGVPQYVGAIDGCHIPIAAPKENHTDYYNRKGWYSILFQGVVDAKYRFLDIYGLVVCMMHDYLYTLHYITRSCKVNCYQINVSPLMEQMYLCLLSEMQHILYKCG